MTTARPRAALMQPTFLPWVGYFALMSAADVFVFLDDFQFVRRSYHQRNRVFVSRDKVDWVTVPAAHGGQDLQLRAAKPQIQDVRGKLVATIRHAYAQARFVKTILPLVEEWLAPERESIADLDIAFIETVARLLGIETRLVRSSTLGSTGARSGRIADILRRIDARTYLSARGAAGYMIEDGVFPLDGVEAVFQRYEPQPYPQAQSKEFVPYLSVLDLLLQVGPEQARAVIEAGARPFTSWDEMVAEHSRSHAAAPREMTSPLPEVT